MRWPEIEKAEALTPEGDKIWENLRNEVKEMYMTTQWSNQKADITEMDVEAMAMGGL